MIGGYSRVGCCKEAFSLFRATRDSGMEPDNFTFVNLLSICSETGNSDMGRFLHLYVEINGVETDLFVKNALVDMYAKCGDLVSAQTLFDRMPKKNVVSWTSMVGAYAQNGFLDLARCEFDKKSEKNVVSWNAMISCYLQQACSQLGDLMTGKKTHMYIRNNNIQPSVTLCNSLIDMYAKCGPVDVALHLFRQMSKRNVVSWNVMIRALAMHSRALNAIDLFTRMQNDGVPLDGITFVGVLCACHHGGFLDTSQHYFDTMSLVYGVPREIEHYACMVNFLG
ncbi:pentatricopeptide repeat-containing protein At1g08070, chloroplastic-like [Magnolia sinica]|uniref:pentatricopeptide repeat-containing protein At1g08070, chloroplastic-like n=1 Tax=Magnolia sinica TaxID=86752 RepID=UPI002659B51E|nr:pentatricopeptide repeat-containing protein At1g08070, chloroplastic-like [Magnolia sinica]